MGKKRNKPPAEYLTRICEFLNITIYELLGIENENKIQEAYNAADPGTQAAVRKLLDIKEKPQYIIKSKLSDTKIG